MSKYRVPKKIQRLVASKRVWLCREKSISTRRQQRMSHSISINAFLMDFETGGIPSLIHSDNWHNGVINSYLCISMEQHSNGEMSMDLEWSSCMANGFWKIFRTRNSNYSNISMWINWIEKRNNFLRVSFSHFHTMHNQFDEQRAYTQQIAPE